MAMNNRVFFSASSEDSGVSCKCERSQFIRSKNEFYSSLAVTSRVWSEFVCGEIPRGEERRVAGRGL